MAISLEKQFGQFLLYGSYASIEIDGYIQKRLFGQHVFDLAPGNHAVRVWYEYMLTSQANLAAAWVPIYAGHDTFVRYETAIIVYSSGTLVLQGHQPFPPMPPQGGWGGYGPR